MSEHFNPLESPIMALVYAAESLELLADGFEAKEQFGEANIIALHAAQIKEATNRLEEKFRAANA